MHGPTATLARAITRASSTQTYYTIRLLVDRHRRQDAFRAYAYFRWVDDILDGEGAAVPGADAEDGRVRFLERQASLLERCLRGQSPRHPTDEEALLSDLVGHADLAEWGLRAYLRNMMRVMDFDARRRGRLITYPELDTYTGWLATAVTGAMHYFIGGERTAPTDTAAYQAVMGAHILHMLRDTDEDVRAGYFNVPRELLEARGIGPADIDSDAYREWVEHRVRLASADLDAGSAYFARLPNMRHRIAGLAYVARFRWLIRRIRLDGYRIRARYDERRSLGTALGMGWDVIAHVHPQALGERSLMGFPPRRPT